MPYTTPGVYVQEISTLPPSVAAVSTAIPAFIGYTEFGPALAPRRIETMMEYEQSFGGPPDVVTEVSIPAAGPAVPGLAKGFPLLYYSVRLYFDNGGGPCYIVSTGPHEHPAVLDDFGAALDALKKVDEPTLIVIPDAVRLADDFSNACGKMLDHCGTMRDRFAILDIKQELEPDKDLAAFRSLSSDYLSYGAAYTPYLRTVLPYQYREEKVLIKGDPIAGLLYSRAFGGLRVSGPASGNVAPKVKIVTGSDAGKLSFSTDSVTRQLTITLDAAGGGSAKGVVDAWKDWQSTNKDKTLGLDLSVVSDSPSLPVAAVADAIPLDPPSLLSLKGVNTARYNEIKTTLMKNRVTLPPSGAIAGIYARVDRDRGVWKAPANVSVASILGVDRTFTDEQQGGYNVDPVGGRSVNMIRSFTGRGTLVWGARTLAGNDNEWRYVPVRRLFIMIEESAQKSTAFAVFEPNDATTWLKVKAMIESFLYGLWEQGALAGPKPEAAYFVNVGLGTTMTPQDILEGRMNVEIGIAAVRPAEFIILKFSHKLQQA